VRMVLLVLATLLGWNAVFILTADRGVLPWIAGTAAVLALVGASLAGPEARARWRARPVRGLLQGTGVAALLVAASLGGWSARGLVPFDITSEVAGLYTVLRRPPGPVVGFPLMVITIIAEEILFRGVLQDALRARVGPTAAVALAAVVYALANLGSGTWLLPLLAIVLGGLWGLLAERSGGLWLPLTCHVLWDAALFVFLPLVPA